MNFLPEGYSVPEFSVDSTEILKNRKSGLIYCADFKNGEGKYVSTVIDSDDPVDLSVKISSRIELRFCYLVKDRVVKGLQITKLKNGSNPEKIHLSTLEWSGVLQLLEIFKDVDFKSIAKGSLVLDAKIINNPEDLKKFITTVATDPVGKVKLAEVAKNFNLLELNDVNEVAKRREGSKKFSDLLNNSEYFTNEKAVNSVGKDEEVWQKYFQDNDWLLGSDVIEILDERVIDEHSTVDLPVKSVDGFLDIIELKLPSASFWTAENNPTADLTKAIMQCMRYINEVEKRANDHAKISSLGIDIVKPRITLIYGRITGWSDDQKKQLRVLNASFHNITILTYDHVLARANKIVGQKSGDKA